MRAKTEFIRTFAVMSATAEWPGEVELTSMRIYGQSWSGRPDLNWGPLGPEPGTGVAGVGFAQNITAHEERQDYGENQQYEKWKGHSREITLGITKLLTNQWRPRHIRWNPKNLRVGGGLHQVFSSPAGLEWEGPLVENGHKQRIRSPGVHFTRQGGRVDRALGQERAATHEARALSVEVPLLSVAVHRGQLQPVASQRHSERRPEDVKVPPRTRDQEEMNLDWL